YAALPFGNPIPTNALDFLKYDGQDFLYFATISCGALSTDNFEETHISVFPNPATDFISIGNLNENKTFIIYDISGKKLLEKELSATNNQIDISQLATGTYFLKNGSGAGVRLIKN
ncbi:MAG TPA: T9SS type A sorting domain-containing protein, partial [Aequorivita sp.]|nr:T9SS type A sorting domain-containing protein [Aequorivita sp.]